MNEKELLDIYTDHLISSFGLTTGTGVLATQAIRAVFERKMGVFCSHLVHSQILSDTLRIQ